MVDWQVKLEDSVLRVGAGKMVLVSSCSVVAQNEFLNQIQRNRDFFELHQVDGEKYLENVPKIMAQHLLNLSGKELQNQFLWWCESLGFDPKIHKVISALIPQQDSSWRELSLEKKIALFSGPAIASANFTMLFLGDMHLDKNAQIFLLNFLKNISETSLHQLFLFWSYRIDVSGAVYMSFGKRKTHAA